MSHTGADGMARGYGGISLGGRSMPYSTSHSLRSALSAEYVSQINESITGSGYHSPSEISGTRPATLQSQWK